MNTPEEEHLPWGKPPSDRREWESSGQELPPWGHALCGSGQGTDILPGMKILLAWSPALLLPPVTSLTLLRAGAVRVTVQHSANSESSTSLGGIPSYLVSSCSCFRLSYKIVAVKFVFRTVLAALPGHTSHAGRTWRQPSGQTWSQSAEDDPSHGTWVWRWWIPHGASQYPVLTIPGSCSEGIQEKFPFSLSQ